MPQQIVLVRLQKLAMSKKLDEGVLASELAAKIYGLEIIAKDIEDFGHNTTRFLVMSREPNLARRGSKKLMTTFIFQVRNIPAALYKAMGGFATNRRKHRQNSKATW